MLLTLTTEHGSATDLGYLLHKHPDKIQEFKLKFGTATVFYPESSVDRCTACLLLEIDPVGMVRRHTKGSFTPLDQYVNDRPYVASSFMSVAIAQVFGTAMSGRCKDRAELAETAIPLSATIDVLPVKGEATWVEKIFEPLGYTVQKERHSLDEHYPEWGDSKYYTVTLTQTITLSRLLTHLYVLIPVFDNAKHYFVGQDELEKLLAKGDGWLGKHPERDVISKRYLRFQPSLFRQALDRLEATDPTVQNPTSESVEDELEKPLSLNEQRHEAVVSEIRSSGAASVIDLGCGEGKLTKSLLREKQFSKIVGMDVSIRSLEIAHKRLRLDRLPSHQAERVQLIHGSLMYRDSRFFGFDAAAVVEVIEHLDPPRLRAFERVVFEFCRAKTVVLTTPNREYNAVWDSLPAGEFRHPDHRFEWTRQEFQAWANDIADRYRYSVRYKSIGPEHPEHGSPTQMAVFQIEPA